MTPKHVSFLRFQLEGSYSNPNSPNKSAAIFFTRDNIAKGEKISVNVVDPADPTFTKFVGEEQAKRAVQLSSLEDAVDILDVSVRVRTTRSNSDKDDRYRPLFGQAFYAPSDFGPFDASFKEVRNLLDCSWCWVLHRLPKTNYII